MYPRSGPGVTPPRWSLRENPAGAAAGAWHKEILARRAYFPLSGGALSPEDAGGGVLRVELTQVTQTIP